MTEIVFVRHGETESNRLGVFRGRVDVALNERDDPHLCRLWTTDPDRLELPGGETLAAVRERSLRRRLTLVGRHAGGRFAVVTRRSVLKLVGGALLGLRDGYFWRFCVENAGYSIFGHDHGEFVLLRWNESCHVKEQVVERY